MKPNFKGDPAVTINGRRFPRTAAALLVSTVNATRGVLRFESGNIRGLPMTVICRRRSRRRIASRR